MDCVPIQEAPYWIRRCNPQTEPLTPKCEYCEFQATFSWIMKTEAEWKVVVADVCGNHMWDAYEDNMRE